MTKKRNTSNPYTLVLRPNTSFDRVLGYTLELAGKGGPISIHYIDGSRRKALALVKKLQSARIE